MDLAWGLLGDEYWRWLLEVLDAARAVLGIRLLDDVKAATIAVDVSRRYGVRDWRLLGDVLEGTVCAFAPGDCLGPPRLLECDVVVAADSAVKILLGEGITPDIVFTDLDGGWEALERVARNGSLMIIHVHGDNYWLLEDAITSFDNILLSVQVLTDKLHIAPGFTDGDRMVATVAGAPRVERIVLYGWCPWKGPHPMSGKGLTLSKRVKLRFAALIASLVLAYTRRTTDTVLALNGG